MTQHLYRPEFDDGDVFALNNAVRSYIDRCRAEIAAGNTYPFEHDLERLVGLSERIIASATVRSETVRGAGGAAPRRKPRKRPMAKTR